VRIGSYKKPLADYDAVEREIWTKLKSVAFETTQCRSYLTIDDVVQLLDVDAYYRLTGKRRPNTGQRVVEELSADRLVVQDDAGDYSVANLGAILFAKNLDTMDLGRKQP